MNIKTHIGRLTMEVVLNETEDSPVKKGKSAILFWESDLNIEKNDMGFSSMGRPVYPDFPIYIDNDTARKLFTLIEESDKK